MTQDATGNGIAYFQLLLGLGYLVWGLRGRAAQDRTLSGKLNPRLFAPLGLWFILSALFHFLMGRVPDTPLIALGVVSFAANGIWSFRLHRAFRAHLRELVKQRAS